jgi:TatD DNase family protein
MIDVHAHLCFPDFEKDIDEIVERARKEIAGVIVSSARYEEALKALELCRRNRGFLFPSLGHHPTEGDDCRGVMDLIRKKRNEIVAVGEVGLDYHWEKDDAKRKEQEVIFSEFIGLAGELGKPLVIHSWDAEKRCLELVADSGLTCIFHCFSGKRELAQDIVDVPEFYISVSTQVLFNKGLRKVAKSIPLERMLLETDAPFLSPVKDKRNVPWNIVLSAEKIAKIRHMDTAEIMNVTRENAIRAFDLKLE